MSVCVRVGCDVDGSIIEVERSMMFCRSSVVVVFFDRTTNRLQLSTEKAATDRRALFSVLISRRGSLTRRRYRDSFSF